MAHTTSGRPRTDKRTTRWNQHKAQRQNELVDAAVTLIEEEGPRFRVQRLAERAGLPRSVLYRHFKDRATLEELIRRRIVASFLHRIEPTLTFDGTIEEAIHRVISAHLDWVAQHPHLYTYMGVAEHTMNDGSLIANTKTAIAHKLSERFDQILHGLGAPHAPIRSVAVGIVGFVDTAVNQWVHDPAREQTEQQLHTMLCRSVWAVLNATLKDLGITLTPQQHLTDLNHNPTPPPTT
ncbi:TetR/AcrR family transcriptional regulator [Streptomyces sp. Da 82-17]|uniref:TetR/AcrR family transcriptional regulator n=1 Tax=Streptomyces sp. Da 82-17 TaxID=3377116 RepID=UPI0038D42A06